MSAPNVAETIVDFLDARSVRHVFGILAHTTFPLGDAIARKPRIQFINAQHEGGAGNMALGYARVARSPAVCLVSAGGGSTNIVTPVAQAYKEAVPLFVISSDIDTASAATGPWASWHGMEHVRLFQPITKQSVKLERVEELGLVMDSLYRQTTRGRQGPVFLCVPHDLQQAALPEPLTFSGGTEPLAPAMDQRAVDAAVDLLLGARAPVVLAGTGVDWSGAREELRQLAELLALPVGVSYTAKGVFPETHPLALGCVGSGGRPYARDVFQEADLVLALGTTFSEGTTLGFGRRVIPERCKIVQIDLDPDQLGRSYAAELAIQADAKAALTAIIGAVEKRRGGRGADQDRAAKLGAAKERWRAEIADKSGRGLNYESVLKVLNDLLRGDEILTTSGMTGDTLRNVDARLPIVHAGEFRAIGTAFATALGVKLGAPQNRVICVTGDGSLMMEQQEFATARLHNIPVLVLVLRNNAYGGMKRDQLKNYGGRVIGTELFIPDLARLAALYGAEGYSVTDYGELRPTLEKALAEDRFAIVDVKLD